MPGLNPFYVALPCNPYPNNQELFKKYNFGAESWVKISYNDGKEEKIAYAQWMDVGPEGETHPDCDYVFGKSLAPVESSLARIDLSPAVVYYLTNLKTGYTNFRDVSWQFVSESEVPKDNTELLTTPWSNWEKICKLRAE